MRRSLVRVKGLGFIIWHAKHEFYHVLLGLVWAWFLREYWNQFNLRWIWFSLVGSLLPDIDHLFYFFTYGKRDWYGQQVLEFLRSRQWRTLAIFMENGHKNNTSLSYHNVYFMSGLLALSLVSFWVEWQLGVILFGAMVIHYAFDIFDDYLTLGYVNPNWRRWGRMKRLN